MPIVWANSVLIVALAVLGEAGLSYFGLGDPDAFSWGTVLYNGFQAGAINQGAWWYVVPPGSRDHALRARVLRRRPGRRGRIQPAGAAAMSDPVLTVHDLHVGYRRRGRRHRDRLRRLLRAAARRGARPRRRVGLRQDDDGARDPAAARTRPAADLRDGRPGRPSNGVVHLQRRTERGMRDLRWSGDLARVPGRARRARSGAAHLAPDRRRHPPARPRGRPHRGARAGAANCWSASASAPSAPASTRTSSRAACASA